MVGTVGRVGIIKNLGGHPVVWNGIKPTQHTQQKINAFMNDLGERCPGQPVFHQAVKEVVTSVMPFVEANPVLEDKLILERLTIPDRSLYFRVPWKDDQGKYHVNSGWRVQMNNAVGPYKGGLRFHPSVTEGILKFLAYEQTFKNSLTGLNMGGAKGGSDFDPKGRSDSEIENFCIAFIQPLVRFIGEQTDVPAGDIGVGAREVGYLFGAYKKITSEFAGVFTGKGPGWGGSLLRPEATGYGLVCFAEQMLKTRNETLENKRVVVSGKGNVALFTVERLIQMKAIPLTMSDSSGYIFDPDGINEEKLAFLMRLQNVQRDRIGKYAERFPRSQFFADKKPWAVPCDVALPCATQNEITGEDAATLISNGCFCVGEGANMPTTPEGVQAFLNARILYAPGKASNAGGVSVSGLEMVQNASLERWNREQVERELLRIMTSIHETCRVYGEEDGYINYVIGANLGGFVRVADAMVAQGLI